MLYCLNVIIHTKKRSKHGLEGKPMRSGLKTQVESVSVSLKEYTPFKSAIVRIDLSNQNFKYSRVPEQQENVDLKAKADFVGR